MATEKSVPCVCLLCCNNNNNGKYVSIATRTSHRRREITFNNDVTPLLYDNDIIDGRLDTDNKYDNQNIDLEINQINQIDDTSTKNELELISEVSENSDKEEYINIIREDYEKEYVNIEDGNVNYDIIEDDDDDYDYDEENMDDYDDYYDYDRENNYDDDDDYEEDDDIIEVDDNNNINLTDNLIEGLQLLYFKEHHTISDKAFNQILKVFGLKDISLLKLRKRLKNIVPLKPKLKPQGYDGTNYNPENLPMRSHTSYLQDIQAIENEVGKARIRVQPTQLCLEPVISKQELEEIQILFVGFVRHYEKEYYQRDSDRLPATLISFHYLLHIMKSIQETGPAWSTWKLPMERLCGMLAHSYQHPYTNFIDHTTLWTQLAHLQYINQKIFGDQDKTKILPLERAFSFSITEEKLHSPSQKCNLTKIEIQKVKQYYATALDLMINDVGEIIEQIQKYGKLRTKSGSLIGSKLVKRKSNVARNNYSIAAKLLVDKNAHLPSAPFDFEEREFYGQVLYYFVHEFNEQLSMLAFVNWIQSPEILGNNIQFFHNFGETSVISITAIDRCVGFLEVAANKHIIIDRENRVHLDNVSLKKIN
ncbi:5319_t:CDS:2 [Funneliformis geosporum]|nr:5319_t:CDS:2 [Funneliformis geosporum]